MFAAAFLTLLVSSPPAQGLPPRRPDVLVILADDLGWRDVDPSIPLPNLYALADSGTVFTRAYVHPFCSPTRYATMFGRYAFRIELGTYIDVRDDQDVTTPLHHLSLATVMRMGGYRTLLAGKWHLTSERFGDALDEAPRLFGFEAFRAGRVGNIGGNSDYFSWDRVDDGVRTWNTTYNTTAVTDATIAWWNEIRGRPRFAWVAYHAPHAPFHAAPAHLLPPGYVVGPGIRGMYESMVVALDTEIGRLLDSIDLSRTIVFFLGDNGTPEPAVAPGQDPTRVKASTYEGGIRVPFVVAGPGIPAATTSALVSSSDIYATLAELLELPLQPLAGRDSLSFLHVLQDPNAASRREFVYSQTFAPNGPAPKTRNSKCIVSATHKLMDEDGVERLFDLVSDPGELAPLDVHHPAHRGTYLALRAELARLESQGAP